MIPYAYYSYFLVFLLTIPSITQALPAGTPLKVIIVRHGEKPAKGHELSCQGKNRAAALPEVLYQKFGKPAYIFVPDKHSQKKTIASRMYQTALPFASRYNIVLTTFDEANLRGMAADILQKQGTVVVVWEHSAINGIAKALGVPGPGKWPDSDFDSIWVITFNNGKASLQRDHEGLHPSAACK